MSSLLEDFVATDRKGNWKTILHTMKKTFLVLCLSGSINYCRYASCFADKYCQERKVCSEVNARYFKLVALDTKHLAKFTTF